MPNLDPKWLELGITGALLLFGFVFLLRYVVPKALEAFQDGMKSISQALKEVNTSLRDLQRYQRSNTDQILSSLQREAQESQSQCDHDHERMDDHIRISGKEIRGDLQTLMLKVGVLQEKMGSILRQLGS